MPIGHISAPWPRGLVQFVLASPARPQPWCALRILRAPRRQGKNALNYHILYSVYAKTRKSDASMTRKLSVIRRAKREPALAN